MSDAVKTYASRDEIPDEYKWDLSSLFASDEEFSSALKAAESLVGEYASWEGRACSTGEDLLAYLRFDDDAALALERLACYAGRRADEDARVSRYQDMQAQVTSLLTRVESASAWF